MMFLFALGIAIMTFCGSVGAVLIKRSLNSLQGRKIWHLIKIPTFYFGGLSYAAGLTINMILLRFYDYTIVYPSSALTYVWTLFISAFLLKEKINWKKITAIILIIAGVIIMNL